MDYKQKYEEALERAKMYQGMTVLPAESMIETIFPELAESEDEKIRKMIINQMEGWHKAALENNAVQDIKDSADAIAWLEKQGTSYTKRDVDDAYVEGMAFAKDELEKQKLAWSKKDDVMVHDILGWLPVKSRPEYNQRRIDWLKSLKGRVQPKQEWSEEDENCLSTIIAEFSKCAGKSVSRDEWMRCNDFLNSLRDRVYPSCHMDSKMLRKS